MGRVIKFRVRDKETKKLVCCYSSGLYFTLDTGQLYTKGGINVTDNYLIEEFTGLTDKDGKEIYEGDILKTPYEYNVSQFALYSEDKAGFYIGKVHYTPSRGFIQTYVIDHDELNESIEKRSNLEIRSTYTEVIGNIYESPELLEG